MVNREIRIKIGLWLIISELVVILFHQLGNTVLDVHSRSVFVWMVARWGDKISFGADYSHGWLIPFGSLFVIWHRRELLKAAHRQATPVGVLFIVLALMMHVVGAKVQQPRLSLTAFILLLWSLPYSFCGWPFSRWLIFPCSFLMFCIPLNFLDGLTFPLRLLSTIMSTWLLNGLGVETVRSGCMIFSTAGGGFNFDVADPCSGLRSLLALASLIALYASFSQKTLVRQWLMFMLSVPIAMGGNIARVTSIAFVAVVFGQEQALHIYHDYSGYVVFVADVLLMLGAGHLIEKDYLAILRRVRRES